MNITMGIARIRRLALMIVTDREADGESTSTPSSVSVVPRPAPERVVADAGGDTTVAWAVEMAAPSFMILSAQLPRW